MKYRKTFKRRGYRGRRRSFGTLYKKFRNRMNYKRRAKQRAPIYRVGSQL
jgi:hypothetical protein